MTKIVVCIMGQDNLHDLKICLDSVDGADAVVYCDGGSDPNMLPQIGNQFTEIITQVYEQDDPEMNGKQRNFYLKHLQDNYDGWWCLALDCDEVVHDFSRIRAFLEEKGEEHKDTLFSVHMRHLQGDFCHEDATRPTHFVPNRLFRVRKGLEYPLGEHVVLESPEKDYKQTVCTTIWHTPYAPMQHVYKRYKKNLEHSNVHSKKFLDDWYTAHLLGRYPRREFNPEELPPSLLRGYGIDPDLIYFQGRDKLEAKHFVDAINWAQFLGQAKIAETVLEIGCGMGPRIYAMNNVGIEADGIEISEWACNHALMRNHITQGDITDPDLKPPKKSYSMTMAYDVLEHLPYDKLDQALITLKSYTHKYILISVPVVGDPNLERDPTHIIKETREWWEKRIESHGLKKVEIPNNWLYRHQLFLYEVHNG